MTTQDDKQGNSNDKLQTLLNQKSSSRIGRLNKMTQQSAIQQLVNENSFTKDFQRKIAQQEKQLNIPNIMDGVVRQKSKNMKNESVSRNIEDRTQDTAALLKSAFDEKDKKRVQKMLKERCQEIIEGKAPSIIQKIVTKMKQKQGQRPIAFYKDNILQYHNEQAKKTTYGSSQGFNQNNLKKAAHRRRGSDQSYDMNSQYSDGDQQSEKKKQNNTFNGTHSALNKTDKLLKNKTHGSEDFPIDDYFARKYSYYHLKHAQLERNQRNKQNQFNYKVIFKTMSREQREQYDYKMKECIPGVGKYRPKFEFSKVSKPPIKFSEEGKEEYVRSRNFLMIPRFHQEYNSAVNLLEKASQSSLINIQSTSIIEQQVEDEENQDNLQTERTKVMQRSKTLKNHYKSDLNLNASPGLIPYDRQSARKFVFEKCCPVNEQRFNMLNLPTIYSKNQRVKGAIDFTLGPVRKELFPQKVQMPDYYKPKYETTLPRNICSVKDLGQKQFIDFKSRVEPEDQSYFNYHMI